MKTKHCNIPIFIPHLGCPHQCVFCDQRTISGQHDFDAETVAAQIRTALQTVSPDAVCEIAYFGGSFTGIDPVLMRNLLDTAQAFIDHPCAGQARVRGIRMSTRPDYMGASVMETLSHYTVTTVELGIQSMDDRVLTLCRRGHTAEDARRAAAAVKAAGYTLIGQMMVGLPGGSMETEIATAKELVALGVDGVRIYPTVVFENTELHAMMRSGRYTVLEDGSVIARCAAVLRIFDNASIPCIRLGLCASDGVQGAAIGQAAAHPAVGERVRSALYLEKIREALPQEPLQGKTICVEVPRGEVSRAVGQNRSNKIALGRIYGLRDVQVKEGDAFSVYVVSEESAVSRDKESRMSSRL